MLIYGHRGSSGTAPENTLTAFRQAIAAGADGVEFDVRASADGVLVVSHDQDLSRTTDGSGPVESLSLEAIQRLRVGEHERIPAVDEVLQLVECRIRLDIEIKQPGVEDQLLTLLSRYPKATWAISAFDWDVLRRVRQLNSDADLWLLTLAGYQRLWDAALELGATAVALLATAATPEIARTCQDHGLDLVVWTVNNVADARQMARLGTAALITDVPGEIIAGLSGEGSPFLDS